jgi:hypothetical protein
LPGLPTEDGKSNPVPIFSAQSRTFYARWNPSRHKASSLFRFRNRWTRRRRPERWFSLSWALWLNSNDRSSSSASKPACETQRPRVNAWEDQSASWTLAGLQGCAPRASAGRRSRDRWGLVSERSIGSLERVPKLGKRFVEPGRTSPVRAPFYTASTWSTDPGEKTPSEEDYLRNFSRLFPESTKGAILDR